MPIPGYFKKTMLRMLILLLTGMCIFLWILMYRMLLDNISFWADTYSIPKEEVDGLIMFLNYTLAGLAICAFMICPWIYLFISKIPNTDLRRNKGKKPENDSERKSKG